MRSVPDGIYAAFLLGLALYYKQESMSQRKRKQSVKKKLKIFFNAVSHIYFIIIIFLFFRIIF